MASHATGKNDTDPLEQPTAMENQVAAGGKKRLIKQGEWTIRRVPVASIWH
jgi:hypothetical protein